MATGYSLDLRTRVMDDLDRGLSPEEAAEKYTSRGHILRFL